MLVRRLEVEVPVACFDFLQLGTFRGDNHGPYELLDDP